MAHPQARRQRDALAVVLVADALVHELVGDAGGELVTVLAGDHVQHHVDGRGAAGAGEAVAVDLEQLAGHLDVGEVLAEAGQVLPVDGAAVAVEQAGRSEEPTSELQSLMRISYAVFCLKKKINLIITDKHRGKKTGRKTTTLNSKYKEHTRHIQTIITTTLQKVENTHDQETYKKTHNKYN